MSVSAQDWQKYSLSSVPKLTAGPLDAPVLLTMPSYAGTLAAARLLGSNGVTVVVAGEKLLSAARWSRFTSHFVACPPVSEEERFLAWLMKFGEDRPGHVLLATTDETAVLFAANERRLKTKFRLYQPPLETLSRLLDKKRLFEACGRAGLKNVRSWFPSSDDEVAALAPVLPYPVLIKPRSQVRRKNLRKGIVVREASNLLPSWRTVAGQARSGAGFESFDDAAKPMIQQFAERSNERVYSISGFIDRQGDAIAVRAATKLLQRMRPIGIGVCFETAIVRADLVDVIRRLCRDLGYFGVFEVEFLDWEGEWSVIDFNPRFYHQMAFDISRGLALPMWSYMAACGQEAAVRTEIERAAIQPNGGVEGFCDRFTFWLLLTAMRMTGRLTGGEWSRWVDWLWRRRSRIVDIAIDRRDPLPGFVHALSEVKLGLAAMPRFLGASGSKPV